MAFVANIENITLDNAYYRKVLYTTPSQQLVVMNIRAGDTTGEEIHPNTTQFIRIESGFGLAILNDEEFMLKDGVCIVVAAGTRHNIISHTGLKLYTIYSPPEHDTNTKEYYHVNTDV